LLKRLVCILCVCSVVCSKAQTPAAKTLKVAVFAPIYLDSVFTEDAYRLGRNNLPRYVLPGLDFYNGVMLAIDSLNTEKIAVEVLVYDSKSLLSPLEVQMEDSALQDASLIIASFNTRDEIKVLADLALEKKIPLISSTYPNDGGITANPFFILLNPTLPAHIEGIYKYIHRVFPTNNVIMFRRKGNMEDMIQSVFGNMNKRTSGIPLKYKTVELPDNFSAKEVTDQLDSSRQNIVICGTLDETFGLNLSKALGSAKNFPAIAVGMPTWDGLRDIGKDIEIVYSTPYNLSRTDKLSSRLTEKYKTKYAGRPSDMVFKGFESMYHFTKLLLKYGNGLVSHLSDKEYKLFNDFDIQPVKFDKQTNTTDYMQNTKLYFIRKTDGRIKSVN
jgi:ABC-type branched-subunit amino acid transport system substrate-binding protein